MTSSHHQHCNNILYKSIGPNCPGISRTVTDFFGPSRIPDSFIIVPEVEERRTIRPLVVQVLASLEDYGGIIHLAACPKRFCGSLRSQLYTVQPISD